MWRQRSSHGPLETMCTLPSYRGEEQGGGFAMFSLKQREGERLVSVRRVFLNFDTF